MRVYHRTTEESAREIMNTSRFKSRESSPDLGPITYVSNRLHGHAVGYGPAVVKLDLPARVLHLDAKYPDGERHYRVRVWDIMPGHIIGR